MAVPKRRMSRANTRARRSKWKARARMLVACSNQACKALHLPHTVCPECGQYGPEGNRRQVIEV